MCISKSSKSFTLLSSPLFPSHCPSVLWVCLIECTGVKPMCMVALNSSTLLSTGILVYSARRFGYSPLTSLGKNRLYIFQPLTRVLVPHIQRSRQGV